MPVDPGERWWVDEKAVQRQRRTALAVVLAVAGGVADSIAHGGETYEPLVWLILVSPSLLALLAARTGAGRPVAIVAAIPASLLALVLFPFGGFWQVPSVVCLWLAVAA